MDVTKLLAQATIDLREYKRRGAYQEAVIFAASLPEAVRTGPGFSLELYRLQLRQGRIKEAAVTLKSANLATAGVGLQLILKLEAAGLHVYKGGRITQTLSEADETMRSLRPLVRDPVETAEADRIQVRFFLIAAVYHHISKEDGQKARDRLPLIAETLVKAGRTDEALSAWLAWAEKQDDPITALRAFADRALALQRLDLAGEAKVLLAERMLAIGAAREEIAAELDAAARLYNQEKHKHGLVDVRRVQARLAVEREASSLQELANCLVEYERMDYPRTALSLLMDLSHLAHQYGQTSDAAAWRERSLALMEETGLGLGRDSYQLAQMDLLMRANRYREAIELGQSALAMQPVEMLAASYEQMLSSAYSFAGDFPAAIRHGKNAINLFQGQGLDESASTAAFKLAGDLMAARQDKNWDQAEEMLRKWLEKDEQRSDWAAAVHKREMLAQIPLLRFSFSKVKPGEPSLLEHAEAELAAADRFSANLKGIEAAQRRGSLQQLRGQLLHLLGDPNGVEQSWRNALEIFNVAGLTMEAANCRYLLGVLRLNQAVEDLPSHFEEAENQLLSALQYYEKAGMRDRSADTRKMLALLYMNASRSFPEVDFREELINAALEHLSKGEWDYNAIRRDYEVNGPLDSQLGKQTLIKKSRQIYEQALQILTDYRPSPSEAWSWMQRGKARALGDLLGGAPTSRIIAELGTFPDSLALVVQERDLGARLTKAAPEIRPQLQEELATIRERMEGDSYLAEYNELRSGAAIGLNEIPGLFEGETDYLCVDWFAVGDQLWICTLRPGTTPELWPLRLRLSEVRTFVARNLTSGVFRDTLRDSPELLRELDELVTPLFRCSRPDELLILSPTGPLHALPLHALELQGEPLLARNPVVYCPSLTVLRHCLKRRRKREKTLTAALFGDPSGDRLEAGELVSELAQHFGTQPSLRTDVTRTSFTAIIAERDLIHFQGHARFDHREPLDSHLVLADGNFTARELFDLGGLRAELVTLAACESATSAISTGDEPLGLIPAFLYAGANAVLATLWPVQQKSAVMMMRKFYSIWLGDGDIVDKAHSLRGAALAIREMGGDFAKPYHWAPYVLQGDWRH